MGYIKKRYRKILEDIDNNPDLPNGWEKFVDNISIYQNLLIKKKNECVCTNCKHIFNTNKKVGEDAKCPNCKNTYHIKKSNLKYYMFRGYFRLLRLP